MELFEHLGVDWRLLIAQLVNFLILMGVLTFFLYRPLLNVLEQRRKKIAESLENADRITAELARTGTASEKMIADSRANAARILKEAGVQAEALKEAAVTKAKTEVAGIVAQGRTQLAADRDAMVNAVRAVAADLVASATERVIGEKLTTAKDRKLIEETLERV